MQMEQPKLAMMTQRMEFAKGSSANRISHTCHGKLNHRGNVFETVGQKSTRQVRVGDLNSCTRLDCTRPCYSFRIRIRECIDCCFFVHKGNNGESWQAGWNRPLPLTIAKPQDTQRLSGNVQGKHRVGTTCSTMPSWLNNLRSKQCCCDGYHWQIGQ